MKPKPSTKLLIGAGVLLVGYMLWRRLGTDRSVGAPLGTSGEVTEYVVIDCNCYRVDNHADGTQERTLVERAYCVEDFKSPSLAHCGGA